MTRDDFQELTNQKLLYLDGATGSNLYLAGMPRGVCTEQWILEHEQVLIELQRAYARAGSQIVYAPTFGANRVNLCRHGLEDDIADMNKRLVDLSRRAVGHDVLIAGDISPTGKLLEGSGGDTSVEELFEVYREQISILAAEGIDLIVAETMLSVDETVVALDAAMSVCSLPVICTLTLEADGNAIYGGNAVEAVETLQAVGASAVGLNCSVGPDQLESVIRNMKSAAEVPVIAKPNAGMPVIDTSGNAVYGMGAEEFAGHMEQLAKAGASVLGGCCGTTPDYIRKLRLRMEGHLIR
ncbi:MAG: homocysteine S-methyltransferase family protein [Lachnospiraceae bacterium]|nr:homocysteine S-methyltransferase family protein [Lachnospiraceae bacterium]